MRFKEWLACCKALWRFSNYKPQPITPWTFARWIGQFAPADRSPIISLLDSIIYLSEGEVLQALIDSNDVILERLQSANIPLEKTIYVQVHDAGSSSPVMLNMLRDRAHLERRGCHFVDSANVLALHKLTDKLGDGAIVYVDDFAGTGNQFTRVRGFLGEYIIGNFSEFLLVVGACEEAILQLGKIGVEPVTQYLHSKAERPLHPGSVILQREVRERLRTACTDISPKDGLGYKSLATMVVLYRNAPNTLPRIFRGSQDQTLRKGLFPRFDDLPIP